MSPEDFHRIRTKLGLSQRQLAEVLHLRSKSHVSRIEAGKQRIAGPLEAMMLMLDKHGSDILKDYPFLLNFLG